MVGTSLGKLSKEELVELASGLMAEKMALLGEGECFVRKTKEGFVKSVKAKVTLKESEKHFYQLGKKWCISADGYDKLNQAAGLSIRSPKTINVGGTECGNPHIELDQKGVVRSVTVCRVVIGPSPIGNMVAIERLLRLDLPMYFMAELEAKIKKRAAAAGYGTMENVPKNLDASHDTTHFNVGPVVIWVDIQHPDIQEVFRNNTERCKFSDRIATRICERNALASHPAIARRYVNPIAGVAEVFVFGGRMVTDEDRITEIMEAISKGEQDKLKGVEVRSGGGIEEATTEDVLKTEEGISDEFSPPDETEEKSESKPPVKQTAAWKKAHEQIIGFKAMDPEVYFNIVEKEGIRSLDTMTTRELNAFKKVLENS